MPPANRWYRKILRAPLWLRLPVGLLFIAGGLVGFLPIVGFWMIPVGVAIIVVGDPRLRPYISRSRRWIMRQSEALWRRVTGAPPKKTQGSGSKPSAGEG